MAASGLADDALYTLSLEYAAADKAVFDPIVARISRSWTVPRVVPVPFYCSQQEIIESLTAP